MASIYGDESNPLLDLYDAILSGGSSSSNETEIIASPQPLDSSEPPSPETSPLEYYPDPAAILFFVFPAIGFVVLVMGSCILRRRRDHHDAEAIRRYRERLARVEDERRAKVERRATFVNRALVTTKAALMPFGGGAVGGASAAATEASSPAGRDRLLSSGTESTVTDLDATISSSASCLASMGGGSESPSPRADGSGDVEEEGSGSSEEPSDIEQGRQRVDGDATGPATVDPSCRSDPETDTTNPMADPSSPRPFDWRTETCAICLEPYGENDLVSYSKHRNCNHAFHSRCILAWLKDECRNDCPCCRGPYLHLVVTEDDGDYFSSGDGSEESGGDDGEGGEMVSSVVDVDPASPGATVDGVIVESEELDV